MCRCVWIIVKPLADQSCLACISLGRGMSLSVCDGWFWHQYRITSHPAPGGSRGSGGGELMEELCVPVAIDLCLDTVDITGTEPVPAGSETLVPYRHNRKVISGLEHFDWIFVFNHKYFLLHFVLFRCN